MAEIDTVGLYLVVFVLICGFLFLFKFALNISKLSREMDDQLSMVCAKPGLGKSCNTVPYSHLESDLEELVTPIEYCGPGNFDESWHYTIDEAYNHVLDRVYDCNKAIEHIEHSKIGDAQGIGSWTWADAHIERDYWMRMLKEFEV